MQLYQTLTGKSWFLKLLKILIFIDCLLLSATYILIQSNIKSSKKS